MILYPAIDIKDGKCVRLRQGKYNDVTVFSESPVDMAKYWESQGARYLHIVDLDGAFEGKPKNATLVANICKSVNIPVQLGGGIRSLEVAKEYIEAGVERLIIGTMFIEQPELFKKICDTFPGKICISLDVDRGKIKSRGWVEDTGIDLTSVIDDIEKSGVSLIIYTDISKDGMQTGVDPKHVENFLELTEIPVIYAGGIKDFNDIIALYPLAKKGLSGIITGRAIYENTLDFKKANDWLLSKTLGE